MTTWVVLVGLVVVIFVFKKIFVQPRVMSKSPGPEKVEPAPPSTVETDAQRMNAAPGQAFDLVFMDIALPSGQDRQTLLDAWLKVVNSGHAAGVRALRAAWPKGARWPIGEDYLRTLGWRPDEDFGGDDEAADAYADGYDGPELFDLLFWRLKHYENRFYRDAQVLRLIDPASPGKDRNFTHVVMQRNDFMGNKPCGTGKSILSIDEAIPLLLGHAHSHPACGCDFSPKHQRTKAKRV